MVEENQRSRIAQRAVYLGLLANVVLAGAKTVVGLADGSQALLADGVNSTSDVIYFVATLILLRVAAKGPDREHPHGHAQSESIASLLIGAFVLTTAVAIFYDSLSAVVTGGTLKGGATALGVALATVATKTGLFAYTTRAGASTGNKAILAMAVDHRNDIYASLTVVVGIGATAMGFPILDPLAGVVVSGFILRTGLTIVREAADDLMGTLPKGSTANRVRLLATSVRGVRDVGDVRAYRFGPRLVLNVEVVVDPHLSVAQGRAIATAVEKTLVGSLAEVQGVYTSVQPARR